MHMQYLQYENLKKKKKKMQIYGNILYRYKRR